MYLMVKTNHNQQEIIMIKIFETYSNVYNTAMMVENRAFVAAPKAKSTVASKLARLFGRG